ncbi:hypothetical protein GCM10010439_51550 [Actinocorallia aurantiaca]|uniref:Methyltransferase family protein n=1 Tax=Actinocorallia aurantiaca TaxID=46204 RepID=A0ABN3UHC5_9ACTN
MFEEVHQLVLGLIPVKPGRVLDVGAGSGRDAAALSRLGHRVVAVEPVAEFRALGGLLHAAEGIVWVDDVLPTLARVEGRFDLVWLSAVWMHLEQAERAEAMRRLAELVAPGGAVMVTLRHGPVPTGRHMFDVGDKETIDLARSCGLRVEIHEQDRDFMGRAEVQWSSLGFRKTLKP